MATDVTQDNFEAEVKQATLPVVVDVHATWCGPCQQMLPVYEEISKELGEQYKFVKLNIDEARELAVELDVSSVPTFLFFKNGEVVGRETGYMSKDIMIEKVKAAFGK